MSPTFAPVCGLLAKLPLLRMQGDKAAKQRMRAFLEGKAGTKVRKA
jgi:hypothetical protein